MFDENALPPHIRAGLMSIRERTEPRAQAIVAQDNFLYLSIGDIDTSSVYVQPTTDLFVRVPLTWPNADPYGVVVVPWLTRKDGTTIDRFHQNHPSAEAVRLAVGAATTGFFSWNWDGMSRRRAEDLAHIVEWARKRVRQG